MNEKPSRGSLLVIFLTVFIDLLGFGMVMPLLPIYADQFVLDESGWQLGLLMASFSAMQFFFAPLWGKLSDRIGRRPVLMVGLAGSVIFYSLFAFATIQKSLMLLFVARIGAGIAGATISTAQAYIADTTTTETRSKGMALIGMAFGMGFTFGPLLGFLAVPSRDADPGPGPGIVAAILSAVAFCLAWFMLPESKKDEDQKSQHRVFDFSAFSRALRIPSIGLILLTIFICIFSFGNFETTLSLLIKKSTREDSLGVFGFDWGQVCLSYAFIGFMLALVQGGFVRRMSGKVEDGHMAALGAVLEIAGFAVLVIAIKQVSGGLLFTALGIIVAGFAFLQPSLNAMLSRRSDPAQQGMVMGVGQSVSSLARILGSGLGIPLLKYGKSLSTPYYVAAALMAVGLVMVLIASRRGSDFE